MTYFRKTLHHNEKGEVNTSPSLTIPNDSLSINEIFRRFAHGTLPAVSKQPQYLEDDDIQIKLNEDSPFDGQSRDLTDLDYNQARIAALLDSAISEQNNAKEKRKETRPTDPQVSLLESVEPSERSET